MSLCYNDEAAPGLTPTRLLTPTAWRGDAMLQDSNITPTRKELARFMAKVEINRDTACWEWTGGRLNKGYGSFFFRGRTVKAHRFSFAAFCMPTTRPAQVCHKCDNPPCVNPLHLFAGNSSANILDCVRKGRHQCAKKTACPRGHPYDEANTERWRNKRYCRVCRAANEKARGPRHRPNRRASLLSGKEGRP